MCIITLSALGISAIATAIASSAATAATASSFIGAGAGLAAFAGFSGSLTTAATAASVASVAGTVATVAGFVEGTVAVGAVLAGGIVATVGAVQQAEQDKLMAEFNADQAAENARLARKEAEAIGLEGRQEQKELRLKMLAQKSSTRTGYAASGVVLGSGTPSDFEADIADAYDSDSRNLQYDISSRQWVKRMEAANLTDQSSFYKVRAKAASQGKTTSLLSGLFKTAGDTASTGLSAMNAMGSLRKVGA